MLGSLPLPQVPSEDRHEAKTRHEYEYDMRCLYQNQNQKPHQCVATWRQLMQEIAQRVSPMACSEEEDTAVPCLLARLWCPSCLDAAPNLVGMAQLDTMWRKPCLSTQYRDTNLLYFIRFVAGVLLSSDGANNISRTSPRPTLPGERVEDYPNVIPGHSSGLRDQVVGACGWEPTCVCF